MIIKDYRDHNGRTRMLARLQPDASALKMRAGMTSFRDYLRSVGKDLIPRSEWVEIDRSKSLGKKFINDQRQCSGCVGWSAAQALMRERALRGAKFYKLSGASIYARINGNRDQGAIITDALEALRQYGACLEEQFDYPRIYLRDMSRDAIETAKRFRLTEGLTLSSFDEICTAIQMGFIVQYPIMVGDKYEKFDQYGCCGFSPGPGNHSVHADGMLKRGGRWFPVNPGTWGDDWGPFGDGRCLHSEEMIEGCDVANDAFTHILPSIDPEEEDEP